MILRAKQEKDVIVFELEGYLDFETTQQFETTCSSLMEKNPGSRVVFNFEKLRFVGSSGINQFINVIKDFNGAQVKPRLCNVSIEFEKILRAYQTVRNPFQILESESIAIASFDIPEVPKKPRAKKVTHSA